MAYDTGAAEAYIRQAAARRGIDPDTAVRVARSEGLAKGVYQSNANNGSGREPSFGPFQLLVGGKGTGYPTGMGNDFMARTGLDPRDPSTVNQQIDFALDGAAKNGWGAWYGAKAAGIGNRQGIGGNSAPIGVGGNAMAQAAQAPSGAAQAIASAAPSQGYGGNVDPWGAGMRTPGATVADPNRGAGLIAMLQNDTPLSFDKARTFLGTPGAGQTGSPIGAAAGGLAMLAQGLAPQQQAAPPPQMMAAEENRPDMSLLAMLQPKKKKGLLNV